MRPSPTSTRLRGVLVAALLACATPVLAQDAAVAPGPRTGDAWIDARLDDINDYGRAYRDPFIDELVRYHRAPRELVLELLGRRGWSPGDVYFACALAMQAGRPCRAVAEDYERDRTAGWGALAQRLGIAPGSPQFHALKKGFVPTYDRWARPLRIDADLARAFPGRRVESPATRDAGGGAKPPPTPGKPPRRNDPGDTPDGRPGVQQGNAPEHAASGKPGKPAVGDDAVRTRGAKPGSKGAGGTAQDRGPKPGGKGNGR
ncbi:hypothetical protein [Lysobacter humi (ex Lee et al. 2017)]